MTELTKEEAIATAEEFITTCGLYHTPRQAATRIWEIYSRVKPAAPPVEVIEGAGQPIEPGWYAFRECGSGFTGVNRKETDGIAVKGHRYIRLTLPEFPPKPAPLPPKPEPVLWRYKSDGLMFYGIPTAYGGVFDCSKGFTSPLDCCERVEVPNG